MKAYMKYNGGGAFLPLIPARDLSEEEAKACGVDYLLKSGLYQLAEPAEKVKPIEKEKKDKKESE